jgi:hypothetical protein
MDAAEASAREVKDADSLDAAIEISSEPKRGATAERRPPPGMVVAPGLRFAAERFR